MALNMISSFYASIICTSNLFFFMDKQETARAIAKKLRAFLGLGAMGTDSGVTLVAGMFAFGFSAVGGLVGWLLLSRKKAFVCRRCGYLLERA